MREICSEPGGRHLPGIDRDDGQPIAPNHTLQLMTDLRILHHDSQGEPIVAFDAHRLNRGGTEALVY
jgi:hypothetical protein